MGEPMTQPAAIRLADLDRAMSVSVGPTVVIVQEEASVPVAKRLLRRTRESAALIESPASPRDLATRIRRARDSVVIVRDLEHFTAADWTHLDGLRSLLERDPPALFILSPASADLMARHAPNLTSWVGAMFRRLEGGITDFSDDGEEAQREFDALASKWLRDTRLTSSLTRMVKHPAYQQIIAMGERAIPPILRDLEREPKPWGPALHAITGANPVPAEDAGRIKAVARAWLTWARENGYRW
jgi:hypothetical protein